LSEASTEHPKTEISRFDSTIGGSSRWTCSARARRQKSCGYHSWLRSSASKIETCSLGLLCCRLASNTRFSAMSKGWAYRHDRLLKVIGFPSWVCTSCDASIALTRATDLLRAGERACQADKIDPWVAFRLPKVTHSVASSTSGRYTEADSSSLSPRSNSWVRGGSPSAVTGI
jgi:hypothetical protein